MSDARSEVKGAIATMLENFRSIAEKNPDTAIRDGSEDFNSLLRQAKEAFPQVAAIAEVKELSSAASVLAMVTRLSRMQGAISAGGPEPGSGWKAGK